MKGARGRRTKARPLRPTRSDPALGETAALGAVKRISRWQWNVGFGAHSAPSRGDPRRCAFRPIEPFAVVTHYVRSTSTPAVSFAQISRRIGHAPLSSAPRRSRPKTLRQVAERLASEGYRTSAGTPCQFTAVGRMISGRTRWGEGELTPLMRGVIVIQQPRGKSFGPASNGESRRKPPAAGVPF